MKATDFISDVLSEIRENIKFLEAKNAAIITLNSALIAWGVALFLILRLFASIGFLFPFLLYYCFSL